MLHGYDTVLYFYCKIVCCFSFLFIITINCCIILLPLWRINFIYKADGDIISQII